jgi:dTDP-4-dehydrorhamnose 3,5-epimerase
MSRFTVSDTPLQGLKVVQRHPIGDARGLFSRLFCNEELSVAGWTKPVAQINHSYTAQRGTVRGLHFQRPPDAEMKLVMCLKGEVWDVAVDIRAGSPTFLRWHAQQIDADNGIALLIPEGFAHGFQTLRDDVHLVYCHSASYSAAAEEGLSVTDPRIGIDWPLAITGRSSRDASYPLLGAGFAGVSV